MLLEDKELKKSIPLQLNKGRGWAFANRNQKINSKNHKIFQKLQSHCLRLWIQDHTLEQNFETPLSNKQSLLFPFALSLKGSQGLAPNFTPCFFNPIVQKVDTLRKRITSGPRLYVLCVYIIIGKLTSLETFTISMYVCPFVVSHIFLEF